MDKKFNFQELQAIVATLAERMAVRGISHRRMNLLSYIH